MPTSLYPRLATGIALMLLAVASAVALPSPANAASGDIRVFVGMATTEATLTYHPHACGTAYWHCDEGNHPNNTALDLTNTTGATGGAAVYFQSYTRSGYAYGVITNHQYGTSACPGADVALWVPYPDSSVGTWIGYVNFVQVNVSQTFGTGFYVSGGGWTIQPIGSVVSGPGTGNCNSTGSHLHQSGTHNAPFLWTNWAVDADDDPSVPGVQINPTGDSSQNWLHWITY